jgi:hypothetical protein
MTSDGGRFATFVNDDGESPCNPPDDCSVCRCFRRKRPDETRSEWLACISADLTEFRMPGADATVSTIKTEGEHP